MSDEEGTATETEKKDLVLQGKNVWTHQGDAYVPGTTTSQIESLPPGIYYYHQTMTGWYLERTADRFEFPYKIYGINGKLLNRFERAWTEVDGNLGILLNGLKGTGKTVTAQLFANRMIARGLPVLAIRGPTPLLEVLARMDQPVAIMFDEFEKTHVRAEHQQMLLTAVDGMARNKHKRLFLFTTNNKTIDENFVDRPSRVRYTMEFDRLGDDVLEDLCDDLLKPELKNFKNEILSYLATRKVLSIDVAKTVIMEVNIFEEPPGDFEKYLNLTEQESSGFTVEMLNPKTREVSKVLTEWFTPHRNHAQWIRAACRKSGQAGLEDLIQQCSGSFRVQDPNSISLGEITFLEATDYEAEWACYISLPLRDTWVGRFTEVLSDNSGEKRQLDVKPEGWTVPSWAIAMKEKRKLTKAEKDAYQDWQNSDSVYGSDGSNPQVVLLRFSQNLRKRESKWGNGNAWGDMDWPVMAAANK